MRTAIINNIIKNSPITLRDLDLTNNMLGKDMYTLQGKGTRSKNNTVYIDPDSIPVPPMITQFYSNLVVAADVLYVN